MYDFVLLQIGNILNVPVSNLDIDSSFIYNGGHSLSAAALVAACKVQGFSLTLRTILTSLTLRDVINSTKPIATSKPPTPPPEEVDEKPPTRRPSVTPALEKRHRSTPTIIAPRSFNFQTGHSIDDGNAFSFDDAPMSPANVIERETINAQQELRTKHAPTRPPSRSYSLEDDLLTEMQLSLIHGTLKTPGMNIITHMETCYSRDIPLMRLAWKTVIDQEPIFHVPAFLPEDGKAFRWYDNSMGDFFKTEAQESDEESQIGSFFEIFPEKTPPGQEPRSTIVWKVHHAFIDGYSAALLFEKVRRVADGDVVQPGPSFSQFVRDLRLLQESQREEGNSYWRKRCEQNSAASSSLLLPIVDEHLELGQATSTEIEVDMSHLFERLRSTARDINITPAVVFNAAWALVLSKYSDSDTVLFGAVLSGRDLPLPGVDAVVGALINTLPFFVTVNREKSVAEFLRGIFEDMVEVRDFQWSTPENGFSRSFESALAVQFGQPEPKELAHNRSIGPPQDHQATEIPLSAVIEGEGRLRLQYHCKRYSRQNMERLSACYYQAVQLLLNAHSTMDSVMEGLLSCPEQALLKNYGNCFSGRTTRTSIKQDLVTLYEASARTVPDSIAVERDGLKINYREFDQAAGKLASRLGQHISPGDVVCVHSDRSANWIIAIFGILKAGGIYCSLDSGLPPELRGTMYSSSGAKLYLTPSTAQTELKPASCETCWAVESVLAESTDASVPTGPEFPHRQQPIPWTTAYLCFTSGSTGTPKGVMCTHEGLVAFQSDLEVRLFGQPGTKISQIMSPAFDGSIHEIFSALCYGATLVLQPANGDLFANLGQVDSAILTPSMARVLDPTDYEHLKTIYLVGEPVPQSVSDKWSSKKALYNMYGPTEGTCGATIKQLTPGNPVTIGGPNPTTRIYILDSCQSLVPPSVIGEIYLAGVQIAKGYIQLADQTKERFLLDSVMRNGESMYKTGDRGYWNEQGEVVCLGRNDRQIKLRGYRLDMNDLEIRVARVVPSLEAIAIAPRGDHLVAMVQPASTNVQELLARISGVLPAYAIPQQVLAVERLPTTPAGKIDYKAVSAMESSASKRRPSRPPRTATERTTAAAFRSILKLDDKTLLTTDSSFLDLGGHSLLQLSLASSLSKKLDVRVPLRLIINHPTIGELASCLEKFQTAAKPNVPHARTLGAKQVSPIEQEWLQKYEIDCACSCFNVSYTCTFDECLVNRDALTSAWNIVLARHRLLRSRYITRRGRAPIRTEADVAPQVQRVHDLSLWAEINRPFQVDRTSPIRVFMTKDRLILVLSHIIADYTTLSILLREASTVYNGQELAPIKRTYPDSSVWYENVPPCYLDFWTTYLDGCPASPPLLGKEQDRNGYRGVSVTSSLPASTFNAMLAYCNATKVSLQQLVIGAIALCISLDTDDTDLVIGSPYINRNTDEDLEMVGLFLEPLPVRIKYPPPPAASPSSPPSSTDPFDPPPTFMRAVQSSTQAALAHVMPWHQLLDHLSIQPSYPNHPLFDVMVTFHDFRRGNSGLEFSADGFEPCFIWSGGAKFKLMAEFTAVTDEKLLLRIEHDDECITAEEVARIQRLVPKVLALLTDINGGVNSHDAIKERLRAVQEDEDENENEGEDGNEQEMDADGSYFGVRLRDL